MAANYIVNIIKILKRFKQKIETYFVSKEAGKGLSTNDFTDNHKTKLESLPDAEEIAVLDSNDRLPLSNLPSHTHGNSDITGIDASKINSGVIDLDRLPQGALDTLVKVANQSERFALTTASVQNGDTVQQLDTGIMYRVVDDTKLNGEDGYTEYTAGRASAVPWSGVTDKPQTFTPSSHTHTGSEITSKVSTAETADKLGSTTIGSANTPIYLNNGVPTVCTLTTSVVTELPSTLDSNTIYIVVEEDEPVSLNMSRGLNLQENSFEPNEESEIEEVEPLLEEEPVIEEEPENVEPVIEQLGGDER